MHEVVDQSPVAGEAERFVDGLLPQVAVDQERRLVVFLGKGEGQVDGNQGLPFTGERAGHHDRNPPLPPGALQDLGPDQAEVLHFGAIPGKGYQAVILEGLRIELHRAGPVIPYGVTGTTQGTLGRVIDKIGMGSGDKQYVFRMYLNGAPAASDAGIIYGIYLGPSPQPADYSVECLLKQNSKGGLSYFYMRGDNSVPLAAGGFSQLEGGQILEWKIDKTAINGKRLFLRGATSTVDGVTTWNRTGSVAFVPAPTPIPSAVWLLGCGVVGVIGIRHRSRKRSPVATLSPE